MNPGVISDGRRSFPWRTLLARLVLASLAVSALVAGFLVGYQQAFAERVIPGVRVGRVDIGGLDRPAAEARLRASLPDPSQGALVVRSRGDDQAISFAGLGRRYDLAAIVDRAMTPGHAGGVLDRSLDDLRALLRGASVDVVLIADQRALQAALASGAARANHSPADGSARLGADGTSFVAAPAEQGHAIDLSGAADEANRLVTTPGLARPILPLDVVPFHPAVTTEAAEAAAERATEWTSVDLVLRDRTNPSFSAIIPRATLRSWIAFTTGPDGAYGPTIDTTAAHASLASIASSLARAPVDATFVPGRGKVIGVRAGRDGAKLDIDATLRRIAETLAGRTGMNAAPFVDVALTPVPPKLTTDEAQRTAARMVLVSSWTTKYVPGIANYRGRNIAIPAAKLDGYVIQPGAWFSFWGAVGEPTVEQGYGPGGAIINGRTRETGALAGGICSTSTTLFNAAARAGLEIGERAAHYYYIDRYPVGLDATVFMAPGYVQDLTFRNDTPNPILIRGINGPGTVTFQLWSVPLERSVTFSSPIVRNYQAARDTVEDVTSLPPGAQRRVEYPAAGFDSWVTRTVRDSKGAVIHQETYFSHYSRVDGIVEVGVRRAAPPSPPAPPPSSSAPPPPAPAPSPAA